MNIKWKYLSLIVPGTYIAVSSLHWSDIKTTRIHSGIPTSMYPPGIAGLAVLWVWFSSVQLLSRVWLFVTPWIAAHQASLSITNSQSAPRPMSIESMMPSNHLILCHSLLLLPSVFPSIRVFSNESALPIRWPKYWSISFSNSPSNEYSG